MTGEPHAGWTSDPLSEEFPGLRLWSVRHPAVTRRSTEGVKERLRVLSSRWHGAQAVQLRNDPVPHAYRAFARQIGMDPDKDRTPIEAVAVDRLLHGGFASRGLLEDALLVALVETGVPLWALDDASVEGELGIREAVAGEPLGRGEYAGDARPGRLVVADSASAIAELFSGPARGHEATPDSTALLIYAVQVPGVPTISVEEAFWLMAEALASSSSV